MDDLALVDMDGTVVDLDLAMKAGLESIRSPEEPVFEHGDDLPAWMDARRHLLMTQPGFWRNLPRYEPGFEIVKILEEEGFLLHILTKGPSKKLAAWTEKVEWCREHIPQAEVTVTENKSHYYGKLLVDDWAPYFMGWLRHRPRGLVIVPAQPWNVDVESKHPNIIRYTGDNRKRVREAIRTAKYRLADEPFVMPP